MPYNSIVNFDKPLIMGVLNVTPDSFSDGGEFYDPEKAMFRIEEMIEQGADIIDVGGESTRPDSPPVTLEEEMRRVQPVIDAVAERGWMEKAIFSIDTYKAEVAEYALKKGFQMVNDVTALRGDENLIQVLLKYQPYVVLMHSKDSSARTSNAELDYEDVVVEVGDFLLERVDLILQKSFPKEKIILDPGMGGFVSKVPKYSFELIERLSELKVLGYPVMIGISRKSCLGGKLEERDEVSVEWSLKAFQNGASIVRVHDVAGMREAIDLLDG